MKTTASGQEPYYVQLDALRFFAVLGVMVAHTWHPKRLPWLLGDLDWAGLGVRLFFVLSGFLITGILIRCRDLTKATGQPASLFVRQFYTRRFLRIFPVYYLTIAIVLLFDVPGARETWGWLVTYTSNFFIAFTGNWMGKMGHFWSLAVEEQFYLIWPWLILFAPRKWLVPAMLISIPIGPLFRAYAYVNFPFDIGAMDFKAATLTPGVIDSLGIGALLSLLWSSSISRETLQKYLTRLVLPISIILYVVCLALYHYRLKPSIFFIFGDLFAALICAWLISSASIGFKGFPAKILEFPPLIYLGKIAYGIYIFHNLTPLLAVQILAWFNITLEAPSFQSFIISGLLTFAIASISWHIFELPINNLKRYFPYNPRSSVKPTEAELHPVKS